ncbi:MAG: hypothetical protein QM731_23710 [Chitinophagaceae bacterium]
MTKTITAFKWSVVLFIGLYILYRAFAVEIIQDEAYSYFLIKTNYWRALPGTANTHWLNSFFMRIFLWLPGEDAPWKMRISSIAAWPLFAFYTIRLSDTFRNRWIGLCFFISLVLNPFIVLYFSVARGYAICFAFIMLCVWQAYSLFKNENPSINHFLKVLLPAALAVLANFSAFYFFIGITIILFLHWYLHNPTKSMKEWFLSLPMLLIFGVSLFSVASLFFIRHFGELWYGGKTNIIYSLFASPIKTMSFITFPPEIAGYSIFIFLLAAFIISAYKYYRTRKLTLSFLSSSILVFIIAFNWILHLLFNTPFLLDRTALFLFPLIMILFFTILDIYEWKLKIFRYGLQITLTAFMSLIIINFYKSINLKFFYELPLEAHARECFDYLQKERAKKIGVTIALYGLLEHYYKPAFPEKYPFDYIRVTTAQINQPADSLRVTGIDHLLLNVYNTQKNTALHQMQQLLYFPYSNSAVYSFRN